MSAPFSRAECCHPEPGSQLQAPLSPITQPPLGFIRQFATRGGFWNILSGTVTTDSHCPGSVVILRLGLIRLHLMLVDDVPPWWLHAGIDLPESRWWRSASSSPPLGYIANSSCRAFVRGDLAYAEDCICQLALHYTSNCISVDIHSSMAHCLARGRLWHPITALFSDRG